MNKKFILKDNMLSILIKKDLVTYPTFPSRQPVCFCLDFSEFLEFIKVVSRSDLNVLNIPMEQYRKGLEANNMDWLRRVFYIEVGLTLLDEVKRAKNCGTTCSVVIANIDDMNLDDENSIEIPFKYIRNFFGESGFTNNTFSEVYKTVPDFSNMVFRNELKEARGLELNYKCYLYSLMLVTAGSRKLRNGKLIRLREE